MSSSYPGSLDTFTTNKQDDTDATAGTDLGLTTTTGDHAQHHNDLADAANKIESAVGINPAGRINRWVPMFFAHANFVASTAGTYVMGPSTAAATLIGTAGSGLLMNIQYIDPADYAVTGYTLQMRVVSNFQQNGTANAATSVTTVGLYPIVPAGSTTVYTPTLGTVISGSTTAQTGGSAASDNRVVSSTFTAPAADSYALLAIISVATRAGGSKVNSRLEYRYNLT